MTFVSFPDYATLCRAVANQIAEAIRRKPHTLICLASGHTPIGVFDCLIQDVRAGSLDLSACNWVSLDEWIGMNGTDYGSCRQMMDQYFFTPLEIPSSRILFFDGRAADLAGEVQRINARIREHGGLDVMLVGIGTNGHIAMNEPGTSFLLHAHVSNLAQETIAVGQKYFDRPTQLEKGITLGLADFAQARLPILMASGSKKAAIMLRVMREPGGEHLPASIVHRISAAQVMVDRDAFPL